MAAKDYVQGKGGYYKISDGSGPYSLDSAGNATLIGGGGGSGGSGNPTTTATPRSGTIQVGGTRQVLMAANPNRKGLNFQNQSSQDLYLRFGGSPASPNGDSLRVGPGQYYEPDPRQHTPIGVVDVYGAVTGQAFYATEFA